MTEVDINAATGSLGQYARHARKAPVIITRRGKPVAALISVADTDRETISLSTNPKFLAILERSRARRKTEGGISTDEMRRRLGLKPKSRRK